MKEYIVRCENNKFTLEGEIVRCKDCGHRIVTDWYKYDKGMTRSVYNCDKNIINDNKDSDSCSYGKRKAVTEETDTDQNEVVDFNNMISAGGRIRNLLNGVAQIKVNTDEIVKRAKEKYEITDCPVCEDAISKHDLWRIIEDNAYWITYNETSKEKGMTLTGINQALNECPPVTPTERTGEWIPVSERLAEFPCIVTDANGNPPFVPLGIATITDKEHGTWQIDGDKVNNPKVIIDGEEGTIANWGNRIIAWMPLPEQYREDGEDE